MKTIEYKKHFDAVIKAMEKIDSLVLSLYVLILALSKKEYQIQVSNVFEQMSEQFCPEEPHKTTETIM